MPKTTQQMMNLNDIEFPFPPEGYDYKQWGHHAVLAISQVFAVPSEILNPTNTSTMTMQEDLRRTYFWHILLPELVRTQIVVWVLSILPLYMEWYQERLEWESRHYAQDTDLLWRNYPDESPMPLGVVRFRWQ